MSSGGGFFALSSVIQRQFVVKSFSAVHLGRKAIVFFFFFFLI